MYTLSTPPYLNSVFYKLDTPTGIDNTNLLNAVDSNQLDLSPEKLRVLRDIVRSHFSELRAAKKLPQDILDKFNTWEIKRAEIGHKILEAKYEANKSAITERTGESIVRLQNVVEAQVNTTMQA